jgi:hypothetical protein
MLFAGLEVAATHLDIVTLDLDSEEVKRHRLPAGKEQWETARTMREVLPHPSYWEGISLLAIRSPETPQDMVIGAVIALIPPGVLVKNFQDSKWKGLVGLPGNSGGSEVMAWASEFGANETWDEASCGALALCYAALAQV